jgi:hypothetical protein
MYGKHDRHLAADLGKAVHGIEQQRGVDQRRPVQGDEQIAPLLQAEDRSRAPLADPALERHQGVDHRVADELHPLLLNPLRAQVLDRVVAVQEAERRQVVGDDPVGLLGHRAIEAPQPGLHVGHRRSQLRRAQRSSQCGVDVARHDHQLGSLLPQHRREPVEHARDLLRVSPRSHAQHVVRRRDAQLLEEDLRHRPVVVLAGVDDAGGRGGEAPAERRDHGRHLDQVRPGGSYVDNAHPGRAA